MQTCSWDIFDFFMLKIRHIYCMVDVGRQFTRCAASFRHQPCDGLGSRRWAQIAQHY